MRTAGCGLKARMFGHMAATRCFTSGTAKKGLDYNKIRALSDMKFCCLKIDHPFAAARNNTAALSGSLKRRNKVK